jgi:Fe-S cluster assembly scaffold protein SufB
MFTQHTQFDHLNALPIRTWRRLGINDTQVSAHVTGGEFSGTCDISLSAELSAFPKGASLIGFGSQGVTSALGAEAERFTLEHRNAGLCIRAPRGTAVSEPSAARYVIGEAMSLCDCNIVIAEPHSNLDIIITYASDIASSGASFHSGMTRVIAGEGAVVRIATVQTLNSGAVHLSDFAAVCEAGARVEYTQIELGASVTVSGCHIDLQGDSSSAHTDTFYFGDGERKLDFNNIIRHAGERTISEMNAGGALFGSAEKIYRGTLDFIRGSKKAAGAERENTLLFSPKARNRSAPLILCGEEDVDGRHAATIGRLDAAKLFYMLSRGLTETDAKRLMTVSLLDAALRPVPDVGLREYAGKYLSERII